MNKREEFKEALRSLGACQDAKYKLEGKSLAEFWNTTTQEDWMVWLAVRVGLWGRLSRVAVRHFPSSCLAKGVRREVRGAVSFTRHNSGVHPPYAANQTADEGFFHGGDREAFKKELRTEIPWRDVQEAMRSTIIKER